jgi:predicted nucleic acid-binding protein
VVTAHLGAGETEVLCLGLEPDGAWLILDDAQARNLARALGLQMLGTAAVLVEAKRAGLLARVRPTLDTLLAKGFRLDRKAYDRILEAADEERLYTRVGVGDLREVLGTCGSGPSSDEMA